MGLVNRTQGTRIASEGLKGRVFEVSLADLQSEPDAERSYRKFRLISEDIQGRNVLTNFHGMDLTTDKLRSMVKKCQSLIRPTLMSRPAMDSCSEFSASDSPPKIRTRRGRRATPSTLRSKPSARRWSTLSHEKLEPLT